VEGEILVSLKVIFDASFNAGIFLGGVQFVLNINAFFEA
jgi:hypothetical protein